MLSRDSFTRYLIDECKGNEFDRRVSDIDIYQFAKMQIFRLYWRAGGECPSYPPSVMTFYFGTCCGDQTPEALCCADVRYRLPPRLMVLVERYQKRVRIPTLSFSFDALNEYKPYADEIRSPRLFADIRDNPLFEDACGDIGQPVSSRDVFNFISYVVNDAPILPIITCIDDEEPPEDDDADPEV